MYKDKTRTNDGLFASTGHMQKLETAPECK